MDFIYQITHGLKDTSPPTEAERHLLKVMIQAVAHIIVVKDATNAGKIDDILRGTIHENKVTLDTVQTYRRKAAVTLGASLAWAARVGAVAYAMVLCSTLSSPLFSV